MTNYACKARQVRLSGLNYILNFDPLALLIRGCELKMGWRRMRLMRLDYPYPLFLARNAPAPLFHLIWIEVGGKPLLSLSQARMLETLESRSITSNDFNDATAKIHFAFDIDPAGFSRVVIFYQDI